MNKTKIDWCDYTWNPFVGCSNGCEWCYARKTAKRWGGTTHCEKCSRFEFHLHPERMDAPLKVKKPSIVFLGSMCDLFCEAALRFYETNGHGMRWPYFLNGSPHQFVVLTKQPGNIPRGWNDDVPNLWVGVSVTREHEQPDYKRAMTLLDRIQERRILCIEPMLGPPVVIYPLTEFPWIILGGLTGARYPHAWGAPGLDAVEKIVDEAERADVPVFLKKNLSPRIPLSYVMAHREYPPELAAVKGEKA